MQRRARTTLGSLATALGWLGARKAAGVAIVGLAGLALVAAPRAPTPLEAGTSLVGEDAEPGEGAAADASRPASIDADAGSYGDLARPPPRARGADGASSADGTSTADGDGTASEDAPRTTHRNLHVGCGCGKKADDPVEDALRWLTAHQSPDGGWEAEGWNAWCNRERSPDGASLEGAGRSTSDVGVTGLALLAFLGAGYSHRSEGPFGKVVGDGLRHLREVQDAYGSFGDRRAGPHAAYGHAIAALAMVEAYGMTGSSVLLGPAQRALDSTCAARNPDGVWRYGVRPGDDDSAVTGWMIMALKSAQLINVYDGKAGKEPSLRYDERAFDAARAWFDTVTDPGTGRVGYQRLGDDVFRPRGLANAFPAWKSESLTAVGMLSRMFLGEDPKTSDAIGKGADRCASLVPAWNTADGSVDMHYWYFGSVAIFRVGGARWKAWEAAMKPAIVDTQRRDTEFCAYKGSWDPVDVWGEEGGRVYATAMMCLSLELWYRYDKVFGSKDD